MKDKVLFGDCRQVLKDLHDESIDMVLTSPPYDNLRTYGGTAWGMEVFREIAQQLFRVIKQGAVIVWNVSDQTIDGSESGNSLRQALYFIDECGLSLHDTMIYEKAGSTYPAGHNSVRYTDIFEYVFIFSNGKPKSINLIKDKKNAWAGTYNHGTPTERQKDGELAVKQRRKVNDYGYRTNIWREINSGGFGQEDNDSYAHPATMPNSLCEGHIMSWSSKGDVILDPFAGSGTTADMALKHGRHFILIEIDEGYYELCNNKVSKRSASLDL